MIRFWAVFGEAGDHGGTEVTEEDELRWWGMAVSDVPSPCGPSPASARGELGRGVAGAAQPGAAVLHGGRVLRRWLAVFHAGVEGVAEAIAKEVEGEEGRRQGEAGEEYEPPVDADGRDGLNALVGQESP